MLTALIGVGIGVSDDHRARQRPRPRFNDPTLATMIGLAVGIDYALFIVSRYRANSTTAENARRRPDGPSAPPVPPSSSRA